MHEGTIVEFTERGSGFIQQKGVKDTLFFDSSDLIGVDIKSLHKGDTLLFKITKSLKGPYATQIRKPA